MVERGRGGGGMVSLMEVVVSLEERERDRGVVELGR